MLLGFGGHETAVHEFDARLRAAGLERIEDSKGRIALDPLPALCPEAYTSPPAFRNERPQGTPMLTAASPITIGGGERYRTEMAVVRINGELTQCPGNEEVLSKGVDRLPGGWAG